MRNAPVRCGPSKNKLTAQIRHRPEKLHRYFLSRGIIAEDVIGNGTESGSYRVFALPLHLDLGHDHRCVVAYLDVAHNVAPNTISAVMTHHTCFLILECLT